MESEFPANNKQNRPPKTEPKKIERIVTSGDVVRRKKPLGRRFSETFIGGDAQSVWGYVVMDILIPAAKDTVADAFSQGIERMLFGEARSHSRRTGRRPSDGSYISYNRYSQSNRDRDRRDEPKTLSRRARANFEFEEIILPTRVEAEAVIDSLFDIVSKYETATVADLYELVGVSGNYTDEKYGWTDLRGAAPQRVRNGYLLDLPRPEPLN